MTTPAEAFRATVELSAQPDAPNVNAALFGEFFEHMSYAVVGGASAELLSNAALSLRHYLRDAQIAELTRNAAALERLFLNGDRSMFDTQWTRSPEAYGFGVAVFDDEIHHGFPLAWSRIGGRKAHSEPGRIGDAVRLMAHVGGNAPAVPLDSGPCGVRQAVYLPVPAVAGVDVTVLARCTRAAGGELECGLRRRYDGAQGPAGAVLASARASVAGDAWQRLELRLDVAQVAVARYEPVDFYMRWWGQDGDVLVDRISALPSDAVGPFDARIVAMLRDSAVAELRWPGGNFASYYRWRDGVGALEDRPVGENRAWGGVEDNAIGTDEYLMLCAATGATPHITVNTGTGTADEAAAWVEYCNGDAHTPMGALRAAHGHPEPYGVTVWELGNETYGEWQGGHHGSQVNAARAREFARAMRAASPVPLHIIATGNTYDFVEPDAKYGNVTADRRWHAELLTAAAHDIDAVSLHSTPLNDRFLEDCDDSEANLAIFGHLASLEGRFMPELLGMADAARPGGAPLTIAFTEWGPLGFHPERLHIENYGGALWAASFLNLAVRNCDRVSMASANGFTHGGAIKKVAGIVYRDPQAVIVDAYRAFAGGTRLDVNVASPGFCVTHPCDVGKPEDDVPWIDGAAVTNPDGSITVGLVNRDPQRPCQIQVSLPESALTQARLTTYVGTHGLARRCDVDAQEAMALQHTTVTSDHGELSAVLPAASVTLMVATGGPR